MDIEQVISELILRILDVENAIKSLKEDDFNHKFLSNLVMNGFKIVTFLLINADTNDDDDIEKAVEFLKHITYILISQGYKISLNDDQKVEEIEQTEKETHDLEKWE